VVAPLATATLLSRMYVFAPGLEIAKRTVPIAWINLSALAVQGIAMLLLVPAHGMRGAAIASLAGAVTGFGLSLAASQRLYPVPHAPGRIALAALLAATAAAVPYRWRLSTGGALAVAAITAAAVAVVLEGFPRSIRAEGAR
jgi:O-antigen/teichoic acid export membrane protein